MTKRKKHRQFSGIATGGSSYIVAGGVVVPAWPAYMYMDGIGGVTGAHLPPCCDSPSSTDAPSAPTAGDGNTTAAASSAVGMG